MLFFCATLNYLSFTVGGTGECKRRIFFIYIMLVFLFDVLEYEWVMRIVEFLIIILSLKCTNLYMYIYVCCFVFSCV